MTGPPTEQNRAQRDAADTSAGSGASELRLVGVELPATWLGADAVPVGVVVIDPDGWCTDTNRGWHELTGLGPGESQQHGWLRCLDPGGRTELMALVSDVVAHRATRVADHHITVSGGPPRWARWWLRAERDGGLGRVVMAVADVDADHTALDALHHRATHDPLTGLVNRAQFFEFVDLALRRQRRHRAQVGVLFIDIDRFKQINDRFGHHRGDRALVAVADCLQSCTRPDDVVARVGGDEFAVLCDHLEDLTSLAAVTDRVRGALAGSMWVGDCDWALTASVGVAVAEPDDDGAETLVDRADQAMYRNKHRRESTIDLTDPTDTPTSGIRPGSDEPAELVDQAIRSLSAVGFEVASAASLADQPVTQRLQLALAGIDGVVAQLRHAAVHQPVVRVEDPG